MQERSAVETRIAAMVASGEDTNTHFRSCRLASFFSVLSVVQD